MMIGPDRDELFRLFGAMSNETLTEAENERLEVILKGSPQARQLWFLYCDMERGLTRHCIAVEDSQATLKTRSHHPLRTTLDQQLLKMRWLLATAAGLMFVAFIGFILWPSKAIATPTAMLQQAISAHTAAIDRCYRVEVRADNKWRGAANHGPVSPVETLLWTRGDRFWTHVRVGDQSVAWGRDAQGCVWFTLSPDAGARLDRDEVPEPLALACELRSLQVESMLKSILADFDLRHEPTAGSSGIYVIHAELRDGHADSKYHSAVLEMDAQSSVLRRVILHRAHQGRSVGIVSFTFVEASLQEDASYTLAGHVSPDAMIYDRQSSLGKRGRLIAEFLRLIRVR
jgi:hypothetical protein